MSTAERDRFERLVRCNPRVDEILGRLAGLGLPGWYLAAGCLVQTVWNVLSSRPPECGIEDYDIFYFDDSDLSWDAEDVVIRRCARAFADLPVKIQVRNQARVHLWYEQHFGVACPPHGSSEAAIDSFATLVSAIGIRQSLTGQTTVYAPYGFKDLFAFVVRPGPGLAPRQVYEDKTTRWCREWPDLVVVPWPECAREQPAVR